MNQSDLLIFFILLSSLFSFAHSFAVGTVVKTSSGAIVGHAARNRTHVSEYLGVPYAKPPVGNLRFAAPQSYWSSDTFNASAYVSIIQILTRCLSHLLPLILSIVAVSISLCS